MTRTFGSASLARPLCCDFNGDPRLRPLAGVVDEIADHFLEVLLLAAKARVFRYINGDSDVPVAMELLHGARQCGHDRRNVDQRPDYGGTRHEPRTLQLSRHLIAHDVGLFQDLLRQRIIAPRRRLIDNDGQRRLERVGKIADMGARTLDDFAIGLDQRIGLTRERSDLDWKFALQTLGPSGTDRGQSSRKFASAAQDQSAPAKPWL